MLTFTHTLLAMVLAVAAAAAPNPHFTKYIGTWGCTPRYAAARGSFTLKITELNSTTLALQGNSLFPSSSSGRYHTLTRSPSGLWTFDLHRVPYPYAGRPEGNGTIIFARTPPSQDRLFWHISPNSQTLEFSPYKTSDLSTAITNHMVVCQRTT